MKFYGHRRDKNRLESHKNIIILTQHATKRRQLDMNNPPKKDKTHDKQVRREAFKKLGLILLAMLFTVNTIQLARFGEIVERVDFYNKGVIDELGGIRQDVTTFGNDLNEIRRFLLLPVKDYSFMSDGAETQDTEEKQTTRTESALYSFLGQVAEEKNGEKNTKLAESRVNALAADAGFAAEIAKSGLKMGKPEATELAFSIKITDESSNAIYSFLIEKSSNKPSVQSAIGTYRVAAADDQTMKTELVGYLSSNKNRVIQLKGLIGGQKTAIEALAANKDVAPLFAEKKISLSAPEENDESITYSVVNGSKDKLLSVVIQRKDGLISFENKTCKTVDEFLPVFIEKVKAVDASSAQEKLIKARRTELEGIFAQSAFMDILKNSGLTLATAPREEYNKILYDVKDADGKVAFSFAIEISSGMFKVLKGDEEIDLYSILDQGSKKKP